MLQQILYIYNVAIEDQWSQGTTAMQTAAHTVNTYELMLILNRMCVILTECVYFVLMEF